MMTTTSIHEWSRFFDVRTNDEGAMAAMAHVRRLNDVQEALRASVRHLSYCPGGEVSEVLQIGFHAISEATEMLETVARHFRAGENEPVRL
jgi:hypothetical protein